MNRDLLNNNYIVIKNFINEKHAKSLANKLVNDHHKEEEEFATNSKGKRNPIWGLEVLTSSVYNLSNIIKENILPTYCYGRVYRNNSTLPIHTDRPSCEISLTVHLYGDSSWPIWIKTPKGDVDVDLQSGDAMVYLGCTAPHWREKYTGNQYSQLFLHYVRSGGENSQHYFDIPKVLEVELEKKMSLK